MKVSLRQADNIDDFEQGNSIFEITDGTYSKQYVLSEEAALDRQKFAEESEAAYADFFISRDKEQGQ